MSWEYSADPRPDIQALVSPRGRRILDVGCASGTLGGALKEAGALFVAGVEASPECAAIARQRLDSLVEGDLETVDLPFSSGFFDYIILADVLEHVPRPEKALARYVDFLAPGGRVLVSVPNIRFYSVLIRLIMDRWEYADRGVLDRSHLRLFSRRSLERLLGESNLEVERLVRNTRLLEDQSNMGWFASQATRVVRRAVAPFVFREFLTFQYLVVARHRRRVE